MSIKRILNLDLPPGQSAFLWGPRKTGKSTYLHETFPHSLYLDLLDSEIFLRYLERPFLLKEQALAIPESQRHQPIIIDEVQKNLKILDDVHYIIENVKPTSFILCGSSTRKIRHSGVNLLGGRAWRYSFFPFIFPELAEFNLLHIFKTGTVPSHYLNPSHVHTFFKSYVYDYLITEIQQEGSVRNLRNFARFLDQLAFSHGGILNYSNIAGGCAIDAKTVKSYFEILEDMLLGYMIYPFFEKSKRDHLSAHPKFYFFDVGIANFICRRTCTELKGENAGKSLEHYILTELKAFQALQDKDIEICFWRTTAGHEVDFVLKHANIAIECKISDTIDKRDVRGLIKFAADFKGYRLIVVCLEPLPRRMVIDAVTIDIIPVRLFLEQLWSGEIC